MSAKFTHRRGYAVALLLGLTENAANLWRIYSRVVKFEAKVRLEGTRHDSKALYNFHESIINAMRPTIAEGVRSIIVVLPPKKNYAQEFSDHIENHHAWLVQGSSRVAFATTTGLAVTRSDIIALTKKPGFGKLIEDATSEETLGFLNLLESKLGKSDSREALYSLDDVEGLVIHSPGKEVYPELILLTDKFLSHRQQKGQINRLMQIAANKGIRTRVVNSESLTGKRIDQLGGIVCLAKLAPQS